MDAVFFVRLVVPVILIPGSLVVFLARPGARRNRALAMFMFSIGLSNLGGTIEYAVGSAAFTYATKIMAGWLNLIIGASAIVMLTTLRTPWVRTWGFLIYAGFVVIGSLVAVLFSQLQIPGWRLELTETALGWVASSPPHALVQAAATVVLVLGALVLSWDAWRRAAPNTPARFEAQFFLTSFSIFIVSVTFASAVVVFATSSGTWQMARSIVLTIAYCAFMLNLAYGVLKQQVLDIDLRIKWGISRGALASLFLAVFFVVATVSSEFLTGTYGYSLGGVAAGLLLFAINPLQKLGERLADAAMPAVNDTPEYRRVRKAEVYRAAYEAACRDGMVTERERDMLAALQEQLNLRPTAAREIERAV